MITRKMEILKTTRSALFVVALILIVGSLGYSQNNAILLNEKKARDVQKQFIEAYDNLIAGYSMTENSRRINEIREISYKIMIDLNVFEKLPNTVTPQEFVMEMRKSALFDDIIVQAALNIDNIIWLTGWDFNVIAGFSNRFYNSPIVLDYAINKKLRELGITDYSTLDTFCKEIKIDDKKRSDLFLDTKAAMARLDVIGPRLQYMQLRSERSGTSSVTTWDKRTWER